MSLRGLDRYITGNYGEDQNESHCSICGKRYDASERHAALGLDEDMELPDECSEDCARVASYTLGAEHAGEDVPLEQTEEEMLENGGWVKK